MPCASSGASVCQWPALAPGLVCRIDSLLTGRFGCPSCARIVASSRSLRTCNPRRRPASRVSVPVA